MGARDFTFYDIIRRNALNFGEREAFACKGSRTTFAKFKRHCDRLASGLLEAGLQPGDRIAVMGLNSFNFMAIYGAAARAGAMVVPLNWRARQDEIEHMLLDSSPKLVFADSDYLELISASREKTHSDWRLFCLGAGAVRAPALEELCSNNFSGPFPEVNSDDGFVIMYTAAVGGKAQGAVLSHANLVATSVQLTDLYRIGPDDVNICFIPLFHIGGLSMCAAVMQQGGRSVIMERFEPGEALEAMARERVSIFFSFAPMLKMLSEKAGGHDLSHVRKVSGIEPPESIDMFFTHAANAVFYSTYGQTECMPVSGGPHNESAGSVGKPALLTRIALLDDYGDEVPPGSEGEICVRSPSVFHGYWNMDESTVWTLRDGWHHTGDVGRLDGEGFLWYVKRKPHKQLIKTGGENVYPAEVEKAILAHPAVAEAAVFGVPDREWGEAVAAAVVPRGGETLDANSLLEFLAGRIAGFKKPRHVIFTASLPRTAEGEIDRERLKEKYF